MLILVLISEINEVNVKLGLQEYVDLVLKINEVLGL